MKQPATTCLRGRVRPGLAWLAVLALLAPAAAYAQPYGHAVAQPFFDFNSAARFSSCRPGPVPWGYEVFPEHYNSYADTCPPVPSVSCIDDFVAHRPSDWYASADLAPLTVDYGSDITVARVFNPLLPPPDSLAQKALTTADFRPEFDAGGKYTVGRRIWDCYRIEATYLGAYEWESSAVANSADPNVGDLSSILGGFLDPPNPAFDNNTEVYIAQQARMWSVEANLRYWVDMPPGPFDVSVLVGARYMQIDDRFRLHSTSAGGENDVLSETENDMLGVQVGIDGAFLIHPRYWIDVDLKGGIYNNQTSLNYTLTPAAGALDPVAGAAERTSWVGELSIVGHWQMTPTLVFNFGYQAMWVEGLALGFENVANPPFQDGIDPPPTTQFDDSGHLVYHGPIIGLMWIR